MKQIPITELKRMTAEEIREGPCFEVMADGKHLFYAIVGTEAEMRTQIASQASMIDASRGVTDTVTLNTEKASGQGEEEVAEEQG